MPDLTPPPPDLFTAADGMGELAIWRHRPDRPGFPVALMTATDVPDAELWEWLTAVLPSTDRTES